MPTHSGFRGLKPREGNRLMSELKLRPAWKTTSVWVSTLELGDFGEAEVADLHGGDDHVERFFARSAHWHAHLLDVRKHLQDALIEAKVADAGDDAAVLDQKAAVAGHSGEHLFVG